MIQEIALDSEKPISDYFRQYESEVLALQCGDSLVIGGFFDSRFLWTDSHKLLKDHANFLVSRFRKYKIQLDEVNLTYEVTRVR